jgi:predicted PurR-regulated permease PerM
MQLTFNQYKNRVWFTFLVVALTGLLGYLLVFGGNIVLLFLFALILAVGFTAFAQAISHRTPLSYGISLLMAISALVLGLVIFLSYFLPALVQEVSSSQQLFSSISTELNKIIDKVPGLEQPGVALSFSNMLDNVQANSGSIFDGIQTIFTGTTTAIFNVLILLVVSIFLAAQPAYYKHGLISMAPKKYQSTIKKNTDIAYTSTKKWLLSRLVSMAVIAVQTYIGLLVLGVPLAFSLALTAGLLSFIPNLGPILSFIPALLVSLTMGIFSVIAVSVLYVAIQILESNLITPKIEQKLVDSPPALLIFSQLLLGTVWGFLGLLLAAPAVAIGISLWKHGSWNTPD